MLDLSTNENYIFYKYWKSMEKKLTLPRKLKSRMFKINAFLHPRINVGNDEVEKFKLNVVKAHLHAHNESLDSTDPIIVAGDVDMLIAAIVRVKRKLKGSKASRSYSTVSFFPLCRRATRQTIADTEIEIEPLDKYTATTGVRVAVYPFQKIKAIVVKGRRIRPGLNGRSILDCSYNWPMYVKNMEITEGHKRALSVYNARDLIGHNGLSLSWVVVKDPYLRNRIIEEVQRYSPPIISQLEHFNDLFSIIEGTGLDEFFKIGFSELKKNRRIIRKMETIIKSRLIRSKAHLNSYFFLLGEESPLYLENNKLGVKIENGCSLGFNNVKRKRINACVKTEYLLQFLETLNRLPKGANDA